MTKLFSFVWWCATFLKLGEEFVEASNYNWACSEPDNDGLRYIPRERDRGAMAVRTNMRELHIYRVRSLDEECYGEVAAIEYCYQYNIGGVGGVFNWTVLILEEITSNNFMISNLYAIESNLDNVGDCNTTGIMRKCCDVEHISGFILSQSNFVFGVTMSAQGNTHGATLLGFSAAFSRYRVSTIHVQNDGLNLSVGSTLTLTAQEDPNRSLLMLWFTIGKFTVFDQQISL